MRNNRGFMIVLVLLLSMSMGMSQVTFVDQQADRVDGDIWLVSPDNTTISFLGTRIETAQGFDGRTFIIDNQTTPGRDYIGFFEGSRQIQQVFPSGTVQGVVVDSQRSVLAEVPVTVRCLGFPVVQTEVVTDNFGYFVVDVPKGSCTFSAQIGEVTGFHEVMVERGSLDTVELTLDMGTDANYMIMFILFVIIVVAAIGLGFALRPKSKISKELQSVSKETQPVEVPARAQDLMRALQAREKHIIETLLAKGELTQNQLQYATGIPKASLSRQLQKLNMRNYVDLEEFGRSKKVRLSSWFVHGDKEVQEEKEENQ